jgi:hypothetical protein
MTMKVWINGTIVRERLTLGGLIDELRRMDGDKTVLFDFGGLVPTRIMSYRGYYQDAALGFTSDESPKVSQLLAELEAAVGSTVEGYKGGTYRLKEDSRLWVANYGETSDTAIVGVIDARWTVVIETAWSES